MSEQASPSSLTSVSSPAGLDIATKRLRKELANLVEDPLVGCTAEPEDNNLFQWLCTVEGPKGTSYESGTFQLRMKMTGEYPNKPPQVKMVTPIYHCNISRCGAICLNVLKESWSPAVRVSNILISVQSLLAECSPDDPLVLSIAAMYKNDRSKHDKYAVAWTKRYASKI